MTPALAATKWTQANKHLRSSVWSPEGELLSAGLPKFTNAGENPEHFPMPASLDHSVCVEKIDGSSAIFDLVNGQLSCRTRGTFSSEVLDNATDFRVAMAKYPGIARWLKHVPEISVVCEITTPNQRIVIDYGSEIELTLIGAIHKAQEYRLLGQDVLDAQAHDYRLRRPRYFTFKSLDHCLSDVATWKGLEGCVIYGRPTGIHKVKCGEYLRLHRLKSEIGSLSKLLDRWFAIGKPDAAGFYHDIATQLDFELAEQAKPDLVRICQVYEKVRAVIGRVTGEVETWKLRSRKDAAMHILSVYRPLGLQAVAFSALDGKPVADKVLRELIEKELDKQPELATLTSCV